jgi:hypothetical protein
MGFETEQPGTPLVRFEDGSAIVKGTGSHAEHEALLALLQAKGVDEETSAGLAAALEGQGHTLVSQPTVPDSPFTTGGGTFQAFLEQVTYTN